MLEKPQMVQMVLKELILHPYPWGLKITQNVTFWHLPPIFVLLKLTCLVTLFDRKLQVLKKLAKMEHVSAFLMTFSPLKT